MSKIEKLGDIPSFLSWSSEERIGGGGAVLGGGGRDIWFHTAISGGSGAGGTVATGGKSS